jgi:glycosyltransferase involved in cell wall biosynthesis
MPELWQQVAENGKQLVGCTVWETDSLPKHWPGLLNRADRILVPSQFNAELCATSGVTRPVHVVPYIKRFTPSDSMRGDGMALRRRSGIPADHFVFYTISAWDSRKAIDELIDAFACEFSAEDPVALIVKTSRVERGTAGTERAVGIRELSEQIIAAAAQKTGRRAANVVVFAGDDIGGGIINAIHTAGDAYVSLTHGEGWGLGAFDAATLGKPVIITGWGGQLDYLGRDYPGLVRYEMAPVTGWQLHRKSHPGYQATQRWAITDKRHAAQLMRAAMARDSAHLAAAASVRDAIAERYAEQVIARQFIAAIDG